MAPPDQVMKNAQEESTQASPPEGWKNSTKRRHPVKVKFAVEWKAHKTLFLVVQYNALVRSFDIQWETL